MNNPPAFLRVGTNGTIEEGMTLRDYFAAKAMQSLAIAPGEERKGKEAREYLAEVSYQIAAAMLAEREKLSK